MSSNAALPEPERKQVPRAAGKLLIASLAISVLALIVLAWLADQVFEGDARHFDTYVRLWANRHASGSLTVAMAMVSQIGSALFLAVGSLLLIVRFLLMRWRRAAIWLALAIGGAGVLDVSLKLAFHRTRPEPFFGLAPHSYSFPSGHALASFCFYGVLAGLLAARLESRVARVLVWLVAALVVGTIGYSRIYLGVHYPTDVLAGYLAAAVWVGGLLFADRMRARRRS